MGDIRTELVVWAGLALLLIAAETLVPGVFLMWLGFAAAAVFVGVLLVPGIAPLWQAVAFIALSFLSIWIYWRFFRQSVEQPGDHPALNRRAAQLVGEVFVLEQAIVNGKGRIKIGDALWVVHGSDLPVGASVRVTGGDAMTLTVEAVGE